MDALFAAAPGSEVEPLLVVFDLDVVPPERFMATSGQPHSRRPDALTNEPSMAEVRRRPEVPVNGQNTRERGRA